MPLFFLLSKGESFRLWPGLFERGESFWVLADLFFDSHFFLGGLMDSIN